MHVCDECSRTCWIRSVHLFSTSKDWCGRGIFWDRLSPLKILSGSSYLHWMPLTCLYCMTDWPDDQRLLHDSELTPLWISARSDTQQNDPPPPPPPLFFLPSFCFNHFCIVHFHFFLQHIFGCCFLKASVVFPWRDKASFTVVSAVFDLLKIISGIETGFQYKKDVRTAIIYKFLAFKYIKKEFQRIVQTTVLLPVCCLMNKQTDLLRFNEHAF